MSATRPRLYIQEVATRDGFPVLVREGHLLAATFHPELSSDPRVHQLFFDLIRNQPDTQNKSRPLTQK